PETIAFSIEDRNYRPATPWRSGAMRLVWSRHEIENYLLEPPIVFAALSTIARTPEGRKAGPLPGSLEDASAFLTECARPLLELHAARMLFDEVLRELGEAATKPADPFQDSRGGRPRGECLRLLATELKRLTAAASTLKELAHRWEG